MKPAGTVAETATAAAVVAPDEDTEEDAEEKKPDRPWRVAMNCSASDLEFTLMEAVMRRHPKEAEEFVRALKWKCQNRKLAMNALEKLEEFLGIAVAATATAVS